MPLLVACFYRAYSIITLLIVLYLVSCVISTPKNGSLYTDEGSIVTLVITSCDRGDLLDRLMESMLKHNSYKFKDIIVSDASGNTGANPGFTKKYPFVKYLLTTRISQVESIDLAYSKVSTKYILHFEEDWVVYQGGFIEKSIEVFEAFPKVSVVSLHKRDNAFQRPDPCCQLLPGVSLMANDTNQGGWGYFTWGAGLRRLQDYLDIGDYKRYNETWKSNGQLQQEAANVGVYIKKHFIQREWKIGWLLREKGFRIALFDNSSIEYARHVGKARHVKDERGFSPFDRRI